MPEMEPLKAKPGERIKAASWNKLVDAVGQPNIVVGDGLTNNNFDGATTVALTKQPDDYWVGKVVAAGPNGENDFTVGRYWITKQVITNAASTAYPCSQAQLCELQSKVTFANAVVGADTVVATNLAEYLSDTHYIPIGSYVLVHEEWDSGTPSFLRYHFSLTPPPFLGKIVNSGECSETAPTDNTYWVQRLALILADGDYTTPIDEDAVNGVSDPSLNPCQSNPCSPDSSCPPKKDNRHRIFKVTNLWEQDDLTHLIATGELVEVT